MSEIVKVYHIEEIMKMLPHRYPFLLVDRFEVEVPGEKGVGIKNVTMNEEFFRGISQEIRLCRAFYRLKQWHRRQALRLYRKMKITPNPSARFCLWVLTGLNSENRLNRETS